MSDLPAGTVTLLYTDMSGSAGLMERLRDEFVVLTEEYEGLVREALDAAGGHEVELSDDSFLYVFRRAKDALAGAVAAQRALRGHTWPSDVEVSAAIGIHTGEPALSGRRYIGADVTRCALITEEAGPGQILFSDATRQLVEDDLPAGVALRDVGEHVLGPHRWRAHLYEAAVGDAPGTARVGASARGLPAGTVTFLFSDIEGSTDLTRRLGDDWPAVHAEHRRRLRSAFTEAGGREVDTQGDSFFFVFARARHALAAAANGQRSLLEPWPEDVQVPVRMGVHTGEPALGEEGYLGLDVVRGSRIAALARGGQVLVSETTRALVRGDDLGGLELRDLGERELKGIDEPERVFELVVPGLVPLPAAPRDLEPAFPVAGREVELASRALALVRDLGSIEQIGPTVERQVEEALRAAGVAQEPTPARREWPRLGWPAALVLLLVVLPVVWLLLARL
jgi:class 3 adenylate cyclase